MLTEFGNDLHHLVNLDRLRFLSNVVDAGASDGRFIKAFRETVRNCDIYAFEPQKNNYRILIGHNFPRTECIPWAIVPENFQGRRVEFKQYTGVNGKYFQWGTTQCIHDEEIKKRSEREVIKTTSYTVPTIRIGTLVRMLGTIDYLKMDVEGAELPIFESLRGQEFMKSIKQISMEYHYPDPERMVKILTDMGYKVTVKKEEIHAEL